MTAEPSTTRDSGPAADAPEIVHSAARWWALVAIAASVLVVGLDLTVLKFVHGMDIMLWTCGGIAVGCALLAVTVLRTRKAAAAAGESAAASGSLPAV